MFDNNQRVLIVDLGFSIGFVDDLIEERSFAEEEERDDGEIRVELALDYEQIKEVDSKRMRSHEISCLCALSVCCDRKRES